MKASPCFALQPNESAGAAYINGDCERGIFPVL